MEQKNYTVPICLGHLCKCLGDKACIELLAATYKKFAPDTEYETFIKTFKSLTVGYVTWSDEIKFLQEDYTCIEPVDMNCDNLIESYNTLKSFCKVCPNSKDYCNRHTTEEGRVLSVFITTTNYNEQIRTYFVNKEMFTSLYYIYNEQGIITLPVHKKVFEAIQEAILNDILYDKGYVLDYVLSDSNLSQYPAKVTDIVEKLFNTVVNNDDAEHWYNNFISTKRGDNLTECKLVLGNRNSNRSKKILASKEMKRLQIPILQDISQDEVITQIEDNTFCNKNPENLEESIQSNNDSKEKFDVLIGEINNISNSTEYESVCEKNESTPNTNFLTSADIIIIDRKEQFIEVESSIKLGGSCAMIIIKDPDYLMIVKEVLDSKNKRAAYLLPISNFKDEIVNLLQSKMLLKLVTNLTDFAKHFGTSLFTAANVINFPLLDKLLNKNAFLYSKKEIVHKDFIYGEEGNALALEEGLNLIKNYNYLRKTKLFKDTSERLSGLIKKQKDGFDIEIRVPYFKRLMALDKWISYSFCSNDITNFDSLRFQIVSNDLAYKNSFNFICKEMECIECLEWVTEQILVALSSTKIAQGGRLLFRKASPGEIHVCYAKEWHGYVYDNLNYLGVAHFKKVINNIPFVKMERI